MGLGTDLLTFNEFHHTNPADSVAVVNLRRHRMLIDGNRYPAAGAERVRIHRFARVVVTGTVHDDTFTVNGPVGSVCTGTG